MPKAKTKTFELTTLGVTGTSASFFIYGNFPKDGSGAVILPTTPTVNITNPTTEGEFVDCVNVNVPSSWETTTTSWPGFEAYDARVQVTLSSVVGPSNGWPQGNDVRLLINIIGPNGENLSDHTNLTLRLYSTHMYHVTSNDIVLTKPEDE